MLRKPTGSPIEVAGLTFPNRIGLAAGFDKNAVALVGLSRLGFGFIEIGAVTPKPQFGNAKPRIFRLKQDGAIINRLGFNNEGAKQVSQRLALTRSINPILLGANLGINRETPLEQASSDYITSMRLMADEVDYFSVNISSPNTAGLRALEAIDRINELLRELVAERTRLQALNNKHVPLFIKLSPDNDLDTLRELAKCIEAIGCDGIVATNTTIDRERVNSPLAHEKGGLSGRPLFLKSLQAVEAIRSCVRDAFPIIGVGGISSAKDALSMRTAGADLIQLYTALVYRGPGLIDELIDALA